MHDDAVFIESSALYRSLTKEHPFVEFWRDERFNEVGWSHFWIVARVGSTVRNLAYVRIKPARMQIRKYDETGDDIWTDTE
jgi:hypothetical protein